MQTGSQVMLAVLDNGVVVQHQPPVSLLDDKGQAQPQRPIAKFMPTLDDLTDYLKGLELFQDEA